MNPLSKKLDKVASSLESKGMIQEATEIDEVSNTLDKQASETLEAMFSDVDTLDGADYSDVEGAAEMVASSRQYVDEAMKELEAAEMELEAAKAKKKKWTKGIKLEKGRLTKYKQEGESMAQAAKRALRSADPSVRGMGSFYLAFHGKKKEMEAAAGKIPAEACGTYEQETSEE
jgi:hypothetical protein